MHRLAKKRRKEALTQPQNDIMSRSVTEEEVRQELSYCQQITRQLHTQYTEGIYMHRYYTMTLKSRLSVTQGNWKQNHWIDHTRLSSSRVQIRFACFLFVIVDWYTRNSTVYEISHETPRLACFAYPSCI